MENGDAPSRRTVVAAGAALAVSAATPGLAEGQAARGQSAQGSGGTARGTVREDVSGQDGAGQDGAGHDGAGPGGGPPIPGVLVSNGREVARTDAAGRYALPVEPGQSIFVVKPSGYAVPVDPRTRLPMFATVHEPDGTPADLDLRYPGLSPDRPAAGRRSTSRCGASTSRRAST